MQYMSKQLSRAKVSDQVSRAKAQVQAVKVRKPRGRPLNLRRFFESQLDLFPVELAVAVHAPHLIPGATRISDQELSRAKVGEPAREPMAAQAAAAAAGSPLLGKSIPVSVVRASRDR